MSPLLRKSAEHYKAFGVSVMARVNTISHSEWNYKISIKSHTILLRAEGVHWNTDRDYGLSKVGVLYQEQGTPQVILRCPLFNGCGYIGCWNSSCDGSAWNTCHKIFKCFALGL
jgi:hypothetical protein